MNSACQICAQIPDFAAADVRAGEKLPDAVLSLIDTYQWPEGFWDTTKEYEISKKCPACGQLFRYHLLRILSWICGRTRVD
ncbi:MAG TPA: hypothetical protein VN843_36630 [Anaerolineales bacterium]|nr:hypothetical protein [Anaerolineales bacterium]